MSQKTVNESMRAYLASLGARIPAGFAEAAEYEPDVEGSKARIAAENEMERRKRLRPLLLEQGVPPKDIDRVLAGDLDETDPLQRARQAYRDRLVLVVLAGLPGLGKTTAAAWWIMQPWPEVDGAKRSVRAVKAAALARWPRLDEERIAQVFEARCLFIDDMGVENLSEAGAAWFDEVLDIRYDRRAPTLITTNLPGKEFKERYGARIAGRIREVGAFFECKGPSMRGGR